MHEDPRLCAVLVQRRRLGGEGRKRRGRGERTEPAAEANRELKARAKKRRFFTALTDPGFGLSVEAAVKNFGVLVAVDAVTVIDISDAVYGQEPKPVRFSTATHAQLYYPGARSELLQLLNESMEIIA